MSTLRPGLTSPTGHATLITAVPVTTETVNTIVTEQTGGIKDEILGEITLIPTGSAGVSSFNGLTGAVQGVGSFNGATGSVLFDVDGGEY